MNEHDDSDLSVLRHFEADAFEIPSNEDWALNALARTITDAVIEAQQIQDIQDLAKPDPVMSAKDWDPRQGRCGCAA